MISNHGCGRRSRGQALVEFALALPMVLLLLLGASDFARGMGAYIELGNVAREGAHYGSLNSTNAGNTAGIQAAAIGEAGGTIYGVAPTISSTTGTETYTDPSGQAFTYVRVTASYVFQPIFAVGPFRAVTLRRTVQMRILPG